MGSDIYLVIRDLELETVVLEEWVGGRVTLEKVREVLARPPDEAARGLERWNMVRPEEAVAIAHARYADGATPSQVSEWAARYADARYRWEIMRDY